MAWHYYLFFYRVLQDLFFLRLNNRGNYLNGLSSALITDRKDLLRSDALRSFVLILIGAGILLAFYYEKIKKDYAIIFLALLFLIDMWFVDKRYLNADRFMTRTVSAKSSAPLRLII